MKKLLPAIFFISFLVSCTNQISGTNDETVTRSGAVIYEPDGKTPSVGATVKVFKENSTDGQYISRQTTDTNGKYTLQGLPKGTYNIWAEKDSFVTFQSSVFISDSQTSLQNDTLKCPSNLTGIAGIQPHHDPRSVTIQVVGTDKYFNNTDAAGRFIMKGMAAGKYTLLFKSTLPDYTPTTYDVTVHKCSNDTLKDAIWLIYTGIPVVTGISANYDTLSGVVHLKWNKSIYRDLQSYVIFRDVNDSVNLSINPIAAVSDTIFSDTIFKRYLLGNSSSFLDTSGYHFKYRVAIRTNVGTIGQAYKYFIVVAASPSLVKTSFVFLTKHLSSGLSTDSCPISDSMQIKAVISNPTRTISQIVWKDIQDNTVLRTVNFSSAFKQITDSLCITYNQIGSRTIRCVITDANETITEDSIKIQFVIDKPIVQLSESANVTINEPFTLHSIASDKFGRVVRYEWDINNTGNFTQSSGPDTTITIDSLMSNFAAILKVTNNYNYSTLDTITIQTNLGFQKIGNSLTGNGKMIPIEYKNEAFVILKNLNMQLDGYKYTYTIWSSLDGAVWNKLVDSNDIKWKENISNVIIYHDTLWLVESVNNQNDTNKLWYSTDGINWTFSTLDGAINWLSHIPNKTFQGPYYPDLSLSVYNGSLFCFIYNAGINSTLYQSDNSFSFRNATSGMTPPSNSNWLYADLSLCECNGQLWFAENRKSTGVYLETTSNWIDYKTAKFPAVNSYSNAEPFLIRFQNRLLFASNNDPADATPLKDGCTIAHSKNGFDWNTMIFPEKIRAMISMKDKILLIGWQNTYISK